MERGLYSHDMTRSSRNAIPGIQYSCDTNTWIFSSGPAHVLPIVPDNSSSAGSRKNSLSGLSLPRPPSLNQKREQQYKIQKCKGQLRRIYRRQKQDPGLLENQIKNQQQLQKQLDELTRDVKRLQLLKSQIQYMQTLQSMHLQSKSGQGIMEREQILQSMDQGPGTMDQGPGTMDQGPGTMDQGPGTMDSGQDIVWCDQILQALDTRDLGPRTIKKMQQVNTSI
jgi:hypothetical protein